MLAWVARSVQPLVLSERCQTQGTCPLLPMAEQQILGDHGCRRAQGDLSNEGGNRILPGDYPMQIARNAVLHVGGVPHPAGLYRGRLQSAGALHTTRRVHRRP